MTGQHEPAPTLDDARRLDRRDALAHVRRRFILSADVAYLDGNSLGALPAAVPEALHRVLDKEWGEQLMRSWFDCGWWDAPLRIGNLIAALVGCAEGQIVVGDSVSVQLFNLLTAAARLSRERATILVDAEAFPTDCYIASSVARLLGARVDRVAMSELAVGAVACIDEVAVVLASAVDYRSGEVWDIETITRVCHEHGALVVWDLCHAAGALPLHLDDDGVDLAVGCTYKYLSGGPGAPAFAYVAKRHQNPTDLPLTGWHGHEQPLDFAADYRPASDVSRARIGTPPILSMLALEEALSVFRDVPIEAVRAKSLALGDFFYACFDALVAEHGVHCITPRDQKRRGSHITLTHPRSEEIGSALLGRGVICGQRPPDVLRFGFNALYVSFEQIFVAVNVLAEAVAKLP